MTSDAALRYSPLTPFEQLRYARDIIELEGRLKTKPPLALAGASVWRIDQSDGFKFVLRDGSWLGLRSSGTEPVFRVYAEAHTPKRLAEMIEAGKKMLSGKF